MVKQPLFVLLQLNTSNALSEVYATGSPCKLADWLSCSVDDGSHNEEWDQHGFYFWLQLYSFLQPWWHWRLPLTALVLGFWVRLKNLCLISCDDSTKQIRFSLKMLNNVSRHLYAVVLLVIIICNKQYWTISIQIV